MRLSLSFLALCLSALALGAAPAAAQAPKVANNWYTDSSDLGFKVQMPDDYQLIPPDPNEGTLIAKYDPKTNKYVQNGSDELFLHVWLLRFDAGSAKKDREKGDKKIDLKQRSKDVLSFLKREIQDGPGLKDDYADAANYYSNKANAAMSSVGDAFNRARDAFSDAFKG